VSFGIRAKLLAGFGSVLALLVVVAAFSLVKLAETDNAIDDVGYHEMSSLQSALEADYDVVVMQRELRQAILMRDVTARTKARANLESADRDFSDDINMLDKLVENAEGDAAIVEVRKTYNVWAPIRDRILNAAMQGDVEGAMALLNSDENTRAGADVNTALTNVVAVADKHSEALVRQADADGDEARKLVLLLSVIAGVVGLGVALYLGTTIANSVARVAAASQQIARGDLPRFVAAARALAAGDLTQEVEVLAQPVNVKSRDEIGAMANDFNAMVDALVETGQAFDQMSANLRELVGEVQRSAVNLADTSNQVGLAATQTSGAVLQVNEAIQTVAVGATETSRNAQETGSSMQTLSLAIDQIAQGAADQARQIQVASLTSTRMAEGIQDVASKANRMATATEHTRSAAQQGGKAVQATVDGMREIKSVVSQAAAKVHDLGKLGERIGAVVETIDDIAEQTNLLALNAAIEAARAGEQGKGFAVVADEVRKLAERSSRETRQIAELIHGVQEGTQEAVIAMERGSGRVDEGEHMADQAGRALGDILHAVDATISEVSGIASAAHEMAGAAREVTEAMQSISAIVEENTAATEEMAAQSGQVNEAVTAIAAVSEEQSASTEEVSASAEEMSAQVEELTAQAEELAATADQLKAMVSHFKTERMEPRQLRPTKSPRRAA
jgi:methyl-accepting chemotaxis protein